MTDKDFLSQFSGDDKKPDSFKEEDRIKVTVERKPVNVKALIIVLVALFAIIGLVLFLIFRPTIEVKDFIGANVSELKSWVVQNAIEVKGVVINEEYNSEYDDGYIIYQSIEPGKKIRKDTKMDFKVSLGADPDELIDVPDIASMYKDEIQAWIKENKLTKTKVMSEYSDVVEDGEVISFEFKNCDADSFTRSSTLNISCSKGPKPAGVVTVDDFVKKDFSIVEDWGKKNKIEIIKTEKYDNKVAKDLVISQSIEAKKEIKQGDSLTVVVSLGKGVIVPDFAKMSNTDIDEWISENKSYIKVKEKYVYSDKYVVEQSIATGQYVGEETKLNLTLNLGDHFYLEDINFKIVGNSYDKFKDYAKELEEDGIYIDTHKNYVNSDKPAGTILSINKIYDKDNVYSEVQRLPLDINITVDISNGSDADKFKFPYADFVGKKTLSELDTWIVQNGNYKLDYVVDDPAEYDKNYIIKAISYDGADIEKCDGYIKTGSTIHLVLVSDVPDPE